MTLEVNKRLTTLLTSISQSDRSYAGAAGSILESISESREPIQLPQSVLELMGSLGVPDVQPFDQQDLLLIMDAMAKTLLYIQSTPDTTPVEDGAYSNYLSEYRNMFSSLTNEQLTSMFTRDVFEGLKPVRAYAMAHVLSDIAADRRLPVPDVWQSVIQNYIKLGD
ncbi:hypothetical protein HOS33_gp177 [Erwinia phage vB_EamM_Y3]|uniref:Uncharacterized protein n=1 Tax=Erwinia phage vB_EamM_Y3 TaxID=1983553 RepID=A0A2H4IB88_9CAUD|nr:hypothetical protein HOS33_gp177 [Erwinia phage vB_EamM_Y3]ARW58817.1 hypothetical protein Y3_177 [Erwinia phage vB_EamM_Y3]QZE56040.1 hypothetical protein pEaSNUABM52_00182 [Erwinia phage pEp_SNUABM_52]